MFKNYTKIILIILVLYFILFYLRLDEFDRISLYYYIRYGTFNNTIDYSMYVILYYLYLFLQIPFMHNMYFSHFTEGGVYTSYIFKYFPKLRVQMNDKLYWADIFKRNNINHPKTVAYIKNKEFYQIDKIINNREYICKPIQGALGYKIFKINGLNIKKNYKKYNNILFQQMLKDCMHKNVRHFRYISLHDGSTFRLFQLVGQKGKIVSNHTSGGKETNCKLTKCDHLSDKENNEIKKMIYQLSKLHKNNYPMIFSIGWDIMLNCSNYGISSYCLEGNIGHGTWMYPDPINKKIITSYKTKCYNFLKENNYI